MNRLKAVVRDVFFFAGVVLWLTSCLTIWISGEYLYKDASGALAYTLVLYLVFISSAAAHYLADREYWWWWWRLKRFCCNLFFFFSIVIIGVSGIFGLAWAQFVSWTIPSRDFSELTGSFLAHLLMPVIAVVAHYIISSKRES